MFNFKLLINQKFTRFENAVKKTLAVTIISIISTSSYAATSYPLKITTQNGSAIIKNKPQRIVVLEFGLMDELNLLGVKPVGYGQNYPGEGDIPDYLKPMAKNAVGVGARDIPNLEAIAKLKPDLILGEAAYISNLSPQLNKIAPTVLLNGIYGNSDEQIKNLKILAQITDTESKVPAILNNYQQIKNNAETIAKKGGQKTVLIGYVTPAGVFKALTANALATSILAELNRKNVIKKTERTQVMDLSTEAILEYNPDQIIVLLTEGSMAPYKKLSTDPLWADVRANRQHQVYFMDRDIWARSHGIETLEIMYNRAISSGFLTAKPTTNSNK